MTPHLQAVARSSGGVALAGLVALAANACDLHPALGAPSTSTGTSDAEVDSDPAPGRPGPDIDRRVMEAYLQCLDTCTSGIDVDHVTCRLACASSCFEDVPNISAGARACMQPCLEQLAHCTVACATSTEPPDEQGACELQCETAASSCLSHCVEQND